MAAFVKIQTTNDSNYGLLAQQIADNATAANGDSDSYTVQATLSRSAIFRGTDFQYDAFGRPIDGELHSITLKDASGTVALISGLNIDVADAAALLSAGDIRGLLNLFGDMRVTGNVGDDVLVSGNDDDVFLGGSGADSMNGNRGIDTVDYHLSNVKIIASLTTGDGGGTGDFRGRRIC